MDAASIIFTNLLADFGCTQWVWIPIHDAGGLLDVLITHNGNKTLETEVIDVGLSNHRLIHAYVDFNNTSSLNIRLIV